MVFVNININMDYPRDNVFTFLFSTYKRTAGIAFVIVLILAVPITIALLGRQQDIRQRAQEVVVECVDCAAPPAGCNYVGGSCQSCGTVVCGTVIPTRTPSITQQLFDFNDDGKVDEIDLNILYAGFAKRQGD